MPTPKCFTGEIPTSLGHLGNLERLYLDGNRLSGESRGYILGAYLTNHALLDGSPPRNTPPPLLLMLPSASRVGSGKCGVL